MAPVKGQLLLLGLLFPLLALAGCAPSEGALKARAADYYNYLTGANELSLDDFTSPAGKSGESGDERKARRRIYEEEKRIQREIIERTGKEPVKIETRQVEVEIDGRFGVSTVPGVRKPLSVRARISWVRVGRGWWLYQGTQAEIDAYGEFPSSLGQANERLGG